MDEIPIHINLRIANLHQKDFAVGASASLLLKLKPGMQLHRHHMAASIKMLAKS